MISDKFVILGAIIQIWGCLAYTRDTLQGKTKPNRVTWFLWAVAPLIAFTAELNKGVGLRSLMTLSVGLGPVVVFAASFVNKKSYWKLKKTDYICGVLAVLGIVLWAIFRQANVAIVFSIAADFMAATPTILKSYSHPETESAEAYTAAIASSAITLLTVTTWSIGNYGFPVYILLVNIVFVGLIQFKLGKALSRKFQ
jgi:hypothetical protein